MRPTEVSRTLTPALDVFRGASIIWRWNGEIVVHAFVNQVGIVQSWICFLGLKYG